MKFKYMSPDDIISVVVVLIVLGIGVYAFFVTTTAITNSSGIKTWVAGDGAGAGKLYNESSKAIKNATQLGGTVFNILGIVITIGAIMSIVGVIYSYLQPRY